MNRVGEAPHREGLGESGDSLEEHVTPAQESDEEPVEHVLLPDDDLSELRQEGLDEDRFLLDFFVDRLDRRLHKAPGL